MPKFTYTALDKNNKSISGTLEASTLASAKKLLSDQHLRPLTVIEKKAGFDPNDIHFSFLEKIKDKEIVMFTRQLSTMVSAGVPLPKSLATLKEQVSSKKFKDIIEQTTKDIESGMSFADALERHPEVFSKIYVNMVRAGEAGGILDDILKRLALQQEKDSAIRRKIKGAMTYPVVMMVFTFSAFFGLMTTIVPKIGKIIKDLGGEDASLPPITEIMLAISNGLLKYKIPIAVAVFVFIFVFLRWLKTEKGKRALHKVLIKTPLFKTLIIKSAVARFSRTFSSLLAAGVGVVETLQVTAGSIGNSVIEDELMSASKDVQAGVPLSVSLGKSKIFPKIVSQMMSVGEETGETDVVLLKVAEFYEDEVETFVGSLSSIIEPIMIVVLGGMVGLIVASVFLPIMTLSQNIK